MKGRILIADDDESSCRYIHRHLMLEEDLEIDADFAYHRDEAIEKITPESTYDLLIVDLWMPDADGKLDKESGLKILRHSQKQNPNTKGIIITGNTSSATVIEATSIGALDYVRKPIDYKKLANKVRQALEERKIEQKIEPIEIETSGEYEIIFSSEEMLNVMKKVGRVAKTDVDVLIYGESGTGKELIAHAIHNNSSRKEEPFIPVNASAIPVELIESELFGHEKGAFTSANSSQAGKFELANRGTLFLDEISEFSSKVQPKLLRAIEYKEIQRVGGETKKVDVRIIAATNIDLEKAISQKNFREDLYYRLKGFIIYIPPLRERPDDIPVLANYSLGKCIRKLEDKKIYGLAKETLSVLEEYSWPGNVRELEKAIEYAVVTCNGGLITPDNLPSEILSTPTEVDKADNVDENSTQLERLLEIDNLDEARKSFEKIFVEHKLNENNWVIAQTARQIGMRRPSLHRKMVDLGIKREEN